LSPPEIPSTIAMQMESKKKLNAQLNCIDIEKEPLAQEPAKKQQVFDSFSPNDSGIA